MSSTDDVLSFGCTGCGRCCRDHYLPLTLSESLRWTHEGGSLGLLIELIPEIDFDQIYDPSFFFRKMRMFKANCGQSDILVNCEIVSVIQGDCVHLKDNRCINYANRPSVCRVHPIDILQPLDIFPLIASQKKCPPEAWSGAPLMKGCHLVDGPERDLVSSFQEKQLAERPLLHHISDIMGIHIGALMGQGSLVHPIETRHLSILIYEAERRHKNRQPYDGSPWQIYVESKSQRRQLKMRGLCVASAAVMKKDALLIVPQQ